MIQAGYPAAPCVGYRVWSWLGKAWVNGCLCSNLRWVRNKLLRPFRALRPVVLAQMGVPWRDVVDGGRLKVKSYIAVCSRMGLTMGGSNGVRTIVLAPCMHACVGVICRYASWSSAVRRRRMPQSPFRHMAPTWQLQVWPPQLEYAHFAGTVGRCTAGA